MPYINLLIKPASSLCNMRCRYCFYAAPRLREIAEAEKERCRDNRKRPTSGRRRSFLRLIIAQNLPKQEGKNYRFSRRKSLGDMPCALRNTRLKLRIVPKPHCSATCVMGRLLPCNSAAAWLTRYWLTKS